MRLLLVTLMPPQAEASGAIPALLHAQLAGLRARHEVTLVTLAAEGEQRAAVEALRRSGLDVHTAPPPVGGIARLALAGRWICGRAPRRAVWFRSAGLQRAITRAAAGRRFDLIQVEDSAAGVYRLPDGVPTVFTEYEVRRPRSLDWRQCRAGVRPCLDELDWQRWCGFQAAVWRRFDRVQVFSARDAVALASIAPDVSPRVRVNPFAIALPPLAAGGEVCDTLLFAGHFLHAPNVDAAQWLVRDIAPRVRAERPGLRVVIAGHDPRRLVASLAGDGVEVAGFVPDLDVAMARAAVVVAPVRIGGGQRMKVLHGMAAGKAVVTTSRGADGVDAAVAEQALAVADDAPAFARATIDLLARPAARLALGRRARAFVEREHTPEAYARRAEAIYAELLP
jgi:glycosyltransferase involved in cell wall biosynthesis